MKPEDAKVMDEVEFEGPPKTVQILWPKHCVSNTWGSQLHPDLKVRIALMGTIPTQGYDTIYSPLTCSLGKR